MKLTQHDIGGEIISILTKGMYADPKDALREYVQNGVDAGAEKIDIKIRRDNIIIEDTGIGMDKVTMRKAIRLGISDKNPTKAVGFMGIGLYSSFHLCDRLTILSKVESQKPNKLEFQFKEMRAVLESQKQERLENKGVSQIALLSLMEEHTVLLELDESDFPTVGTRVELFGLDEEFFDSLSKFEDVAEYLEKSVPLPFSPDFTYGNEIQQYITAKCKEHNAEFRVIDLFLQINSRKEKLFRPYKDSDFNPAPLPPNYKELTSAGEFLGIAWACLNAANSVISNEKVRGFLIKKHGFTIGTRSNLLGTFGAKFFNRYVGEIIIVNPKLLPNGARSDFEYSALRTILQKTIEDVANDYNGDANIHQERVKAEIDLDKLIKLYRETKGRINGISANRELLLEAYTNLTKAFNAYKRKHDSSYKIKEERKKDSSEIVELMPPLIQEISDLLTLKKNNGKIANKNRAQIAEELNAAPTAHDNQEPQPNNLIEVIELIGIPFNSEIHVIISILDEQFVKPQSKNDEDYLQLLKRLKGEIEETLSEPEEN